MSALTDQVLSHLEQQAIASDVALDELDGHLAAELGVPIEALYAYLRVCYAAQRCGLPAGERSS